MNTEKYKNLIETLPKESEELWFEYNLEVNKILQENQELKAKIKTIFEDPNDLTLMFMYCDEKAKDKIKELKLQLEDKEEENFNLRENIYIEKMSFPSEGRNIKELIEMPTYEELQQENQELKKQLEEYKNQLDKGLYSVCLPYRTGYNKAVEEKENQQKEFIEYLTEKIDICDGAIDVFKSDLEEISYGGRIAGKTYISNQIMKNETAKKCFTEILSKYHEIIGGKYE